MAALHPMRSRAPDRNRAGAAILMLVMKFQASPTRAADAAPECGLVEEHPGEQRTETQSDLRSGSYMRSLAFACIIPGAEFL